MNVVLKLFRQVCEHLRLFQISELFSSFDDQPLEHQIELVDALEEFLHMWMIKHGLNGYIFFVF